MKRRRASALYILLIVITILFILGVSLVQMVGMGTGQVKKFGKNTLAHYLAEAGIHLAIQKMEKTFDSPLVKGGGPKPAPGSGGPGSPSGVPELAASRDPMELNQELLDLLDIDRAREWARTFDFGNAVVKGSKIRVTAELFGIQKNEFSTYIDRVEVVPQSLEQYREKAGDEEGGTAAPSPLGGWSGRLKLTSVAECDGTRSVIEVIKGIKVVDCTPPASDHTLFIHSSKTEYLKEGKFILSNLTLPDVIQDLLFDLGNKINEMLRLQLSDTKAQSLDNISKINDMLTNKLDEGKMSDALKLVYELAQHANDEKIKDTVDNIILSLNPRDWGRVRTNGVLHVYLPFFAADDIINYFADTSIFGHQRPEIGYLYNDNRLHDPYLSVYTHFEGYVYKNYRRLNPLILGPTKEPQVVPPQRYTINTRMNYVKRYPEREAVKNLKRLIDHGQKYAHVVYKEKKKLFGTPQQPLDLSGITYATEDLTIAGPYQGRGLIVTDKNIIIAGDLTQMNSHDMLGLVSLQGQITLKQSHTKIQAGLYAFDCIVGSKSQSVDIVGNLACETLNREKMPRYFTCRFDPDLKNHMTDNVVGTISRRDISYRELPAGQETREAEEK
ncbi:MAG: hypothetical protein HY303_19375 [Candidatus Wallbacteria bacterium]|nr:hypothetical protein [Candidatus Wallbacteria bacterium]